MPIPARLCKFNKKREQLSCPYKTDFIIDAPPCQDFFQRSTEKGAIFYTLVIIHKFLSQNSEKLFTTHKKCAIMIMQTGNTTPPRWKSLVSQFHERTSYP